MTSCIERLEDRRLLSVTPILAGLPSLSKPIGIHVPVIVDTGSVSGSVADSSGNAISGALVVLYENKPVPAGSTTTTPPVIPIPILFAKTDAMGNFSLPKVPVGTYSAAVSKQGFNSTTVDSVVVTKDTNTDVGKITLTAQQTGTVTGTVSDSATGKGIADAVVFLAPKVPPPVPLFGFRAELVAKTDSNGNFSLENVPTGMYTITAFKQGYQKSTPMDLTVTNGTNPPVAITLTALPTPVLGTVTGQVLDASTTKPLAGALVVLYPAPQTPPGGSTGNPTGGTMMQPLPWSVRFARTDQNGNYTLTNVRAGTYVVTAFDKGYQKATSAPFMVGAGTTTAPTLSLTPIAPPTFGSVTGNVTDTSGKAIAGAFVELVPSKPSSGTPTPTPTPFPLPPVEFTKTDQNGNYNFAMVRTGSYVVNVLADGFQKGSSDQFTVTQGMTFTVPTIKLAPEPPPTTEPVSGEVVDSSKNPVAGATVVLEPQSPVVTGTGAFQPAPWLPGPVQFTKTDANGMYTFSNVPSGTYVVTAFDKTDGLFGSSMPFTVAASPVTVPTIVLMSALPPVPVPLRL